MDAKAHWEKVRADKAPEAASWYRPHLETSLALIERAAPACSAAILDVGGGESTLVDDLLARGYRNLTVLDISPTALERARARLGAAAEQVRWLAGDIAEIELPSRAYDVWHDRAAFHFLTAPERRRAYVRNAERSLKPGGQVIVATFALQGPAKCSGLDVVRYDAASLAAEFGARFRLEESCEELHRTPAGAVQPFLYCRLRLDESFAAPSGSV